MLEGEDKPRAAQKPKLKMGGSLGALPTENLLQMIGNLRLSARLLLEEPSTKDFCLLTFREGELVPEIESSHYPSLTETLAQDKTVDRASLNELSLAHSELPLWNRLLVSGLTNRVQLKDYLVEGVRITLERFRNLGGLHFELSPIPTERLGTSQGYPVSEICSLARRPKEAPVAQPKQEKEETIPEILRELISQTAAAKTTPPPQDQKPQENNDMRDLLLQLRELISGSLACYILKSEDRRIEASSTTPMLDDHPDFHSIISLVFDQLAASPERLLKINEVFFFSDEYVVGLNLQHSGYIILVICKKGTPLGVILTGIRKASLKAKELFK
ncbi:hypothetical protein GX441_04960 [bacterium]|nr:hypothetical protein [bacterium]